jgi:N-acetyl-1-D-myo-inositol-2-amino-2-deoxy-alpha-D-glucopyranoside deacetylase
MSQERNSTILAVFAHADDEFVISPLLARYGREKADVFLVIVTRGEKWAPQTNLSPGEEIAKVRAEEARCTARALGIHPPILLQFDDGSLGERIRPPWANLTKVESELRKLLAELRPDVVITWGPDGGYGHPDHRLVGAIVTQLVQRKAHGAPRHLLYAGFPRGRVPEEPKPGDQPWAPVEIEYLTVQVPYTDADLNAAGKSFACYKSQFPDEILRLVPQQLHKDVWQGRVYLRPWFGSAKGQDLFALSP